MSENLKTLLQQALDMLEEQALHIEAPTLPAGEELLKRIRAAISQQVEPAPAQDEPPQSGITIEKDVFGTVHIKLGDFDYIQIQYQYPYTDNASQNALAKRIAELLTRPAQTEQQPCHVCEDLEPDARRYRTLRQMHWNDGPLAVVANPKASVKLGADCPSGECLDQMLDALPEGQLP